MLTVFSPIFVADTKITFIYNFVAPLSGDISQQLTEAATGGVLCKKVFLKISKIHRKASVPESLF